MNRAETNRLDHSTQLINNRSMIAGKLIPAIISVVILVILDQMSKFYITHTLDLYGSIPIVEDVFELHYIQNAGAAWGLLQNRQLLFYIITGIVLILGCFVYYRCVKFNLFQDIRVVLILILSGAIGNFIDRLRLQYVIDFLYFKLINFPVFNVADCYVTIGVFLLFILVLFKYKEEDFDVLLHSVNPSKDNNAEDTINDEL